MSTKPYLRSRLVKVLLLLSVVLPASSGRARTACRKDVLPNGLTLIVCPDFDLPLATIEVAVRAGSFVEPPNLNGLSHLYEHMFFKGNRTLPDQQAYLARVRQLGMVFNGTTSEEAVTYFFTLPAANLAPGLAFMRDALLYPKFDPGELAKERRVVLAEYDRQEASPMSALRRAVARALWYAHWSRKNPIGDRKVVASATPEQMRLLKQLYYQPTNAALIVTGAVEPKRVRTLAERIFGSWRGRPVRLPDVRHPPLSGHKFVVLHRPVRRAVILLSFQGPALRDDVAASYAGDVLTMAVNLRQGPLYRGLVEPGLAQAASGFYITRRAKGPVSFVVKTTPEKVRAALCGLTGLLAKLDRAVTDEDLKAGKKLVEISYLYDREAPSEFAHLLGFWWATAGMEYYTTYLDHIRQVQRRDIERFVRKYIQGKPMVVGLLLPNGVQVSAERLRRCLWPTGEERKGPSGSREARP